MELPPIPLNQCSTRDLPWLSKQWLDEGYCWRCESTDAGQLVQDPLAPKGDPIKVCATCALERRNRLVDDLAA
jgi:hypothetical protein